MVEFNTQKEVDNYIKSLGVFLNKGQLCMKTDDDNYILINDKKPKIINYVENNTSPFSEINISFPTINLEIFDKYNSKEEKIETHKMIMDEIKDSSKFLKKGWRLIHLKESYRDDSRKKISYLIYDYGNRTFNPIRDDFISKSEKKNAYDVVNITVIKNLQKEDFENHFKQAKEIEMKKWDEIPIYDVGELNE